uniref:Uncharacterized protein n=1 Tax=Anguilla anguilla TaxID=7936 RepID=A0A0E9W7P7_ANGAN
MVGLRMRFCFSSPSLLTSSYLHFTSEIFERELAPMSFVK